MAEFTQFLTQLSQGLVDWIMNPNPLIGLLGAFLGGILISLTPCVYPVIPLTVGFFGAQGSKSRWQVFGYALVYVSGLALVYTGLGVGAALLGATFGQLSGNPWVNLFVGNIILLAGLSMLGLFDISLGGLIGGGAGGTKSASFLQALVMGLTAGIVIAPCAAPVLAVLLTLVARDGQVVWGGVLLFVHAWGIGVLFLVIAFFSGSLSMLPRSGVWMEKIKHGFGWVMVIIAQFFIVTAGMYFVGSGGLLSAELSSQVYELDIEPEMQRPTLNQPISSFSWKPAPLTIASLQDHWNRDEVVWLTLWASWCKACQEEVPLLNELYHQYREQGFVIYGINDKEDFPIVWSCINRWGIEYPVIADPDGFITEAYGTTHLPYNVILDKNGVVRHEGVAFPRDKATFIQMLLDE